MRLSVALYSLALAAAAPADVSSVGTAVTRTTTNGDVVGRVDSAGIEFFFGIPVAADASGANRFKAPQAVSSWASPLATVVEKVCAHVGLDADGAPTFQGQEDCISVDVITTTGSAGLPVLAYIHGGGFVSHDPPFDRLTNAYYQKSVTGDGRKAVSVHLHYRLGALGFLAHPGLTAETAYAGSGNWGLLDCIAHLQWIAANVANFGGDPSKVTILGTSSGASMVMMLTASPLSAGLFAHAVAQSPYIGGNYKAGSYGITARYAMASMFVSANGCSSGATTSSVGVPSGADAAAEVACLRGKPASMLGAGVAIRAHTAFDAVYGAGAAGLITYNSIECWPVVDGHFLTQAPLDAWASGVGSAVTIVVGMNADEYSLFYPNPQADYGSEMYKGMLPYTTLDHSFVLAMEDVSLTATCQQWLDAIWAVSRDTALLASIDSYYGDVAAGYPRAVQKSTDAWFASPLRHIVSTLVGQAGRAPGTVYRYLFAAEPGATVASMMENAFEHMGASHGSELTYTLGWYADQNGYLGYGRDTPHTISMEEAMMGVTMKRFWLNLMYSGDPGTVDAVTWSANTASARHTIVFKPSLAGGAALNPCLDTTACRTEPSNDYRAAASLAWQDRRGTYTWGGPPASAATTCSSGVTGPSQAGADYTCGITVLESVSLGAAGLAMLVVLCQIAYLALRQGGRPSAAASAK